MNRSRKAAKLHSVISHDNNGNVSLPADLTLSAAPGSVDNSTRVTTTAWIRSYVGAEFASMVASAPATLDTLAELAAALGNDPNFATTVATSIGTRVPQTRTITINGVSFDLSADRSWTIAGGVTSFNTRTGAITLISADVTGALGFTPYNATNPSGYITGITSGMVTTALGYTPYNSSNPSGYITGITSGNVTSALGYTPVQPNGTGASGTWGISITGNANYALNSTRLYASNAPYTFGGGSPYYMTMNYDGTRWLLEVTPGTPAAVRVAYADTAGSVSSVAWGNISSKPSYLMYYQGFTLDANTMDSNATGFTYGVSAPYTGPIARFSANGGYDLWLNAPYGGDGYGLAFRTRNGDTGTFNSWRYPAVYNVNVNGGGALYATIYYDQSDTSYFVDPNSTSRLLAVNAPSGYTSVGNPWGTANSAFFPNGITTAGGTNWIYGGTFIGNAPDNGSGVEVRANGSSYFRSSNVNGTWGYAGLFVDRNNGQNNYVPWSFENEYGNHSWGIVARFHIQTANQDKSAIQFTSAGSNERWSIGYCSATDFNFRITQNQGFRIDGSGISDGWGTERFVINTSGNASFGGTIQNGSVWINNGANFNNYNENIRLFNAPNGVSVIAFSASGVGGTPPTSILGYSDRMEFRRGDGAQFRIYDGYTESMGSSRAPIFYDSNNTGFYLDPNSRTNINTLTVNGGTNYFYGITYFETNNGGYLGSTDSAKLQAYSSSNNSAFMSFHKGGHYAVNFGLDADNVMRIGGWSAAANRWQLDMSGNMTVAGDVTAFSDARVKENVITVDNALSKVLALRGVYYNRTDSADKNRKIGVIAQETLTVIPEVVNQDNEGMYNVSYGNLGGLFIEAIKEQTAQIQSQQSEIEELKDLVKQLLAK